MFFARIRAPWLLLLFLIPIIASVVFAQLAAYNEAKHLRFLILSVNLSTVFAMLFVCWIATLSYILAPRFRSKLFALVGLGLSVLFRLWQDNFTLDVVSVTGAIPQLEFISVDSPVFVMHVIVSLFMITLLVQLALWLLKKEKELGLDTTSKGKTILWFIVFPVGMWFIQPRMRKILEVLESD
ncbi:MAG: hypothetical protein ABIQ40_01825 [Bacteroidia bacterium]